MPLSVEFANHAMREYSSITKPRRLTATEFLVYCAVVSCCNKSLEIDGVATPVFVSEIQKQLAASRETVRRTMNTLEALGLVVKMDRKWFYN